jgi:hypothetical protein
MKDEVEEFLRRVAELRAQAETQAKGPSRPPPRPKPPSGSSPPLVPPTRQPPVRPPASSLPPLTAEAVEAELADGLDRMGQRVTEDLREATTIAEHARSLGADAKAAENRLEAHLHEVFDHQLGQLKQSKTAVGQPALDIAAADTPLSDMVRLLRSPQSIRDAIVIAEVLKRPEHLW